MTGDVVIRCPQCGTTQPSLGECDACHEADARYFCTNHTPGRWLDGPACPACGARHGAPTRGGSTRGVPAGAPPRAGAPLPPSPGSARRTPPHAAPRRGDAPPLARRRPAPPPEAPDVVVWEEGPDPSPWGAARGGPLGGRWPGRPPFPVIRVGGSLLGCAVRLVVSLVVFAVLAVLAFFGSCGSF